MRAISKALCKFVQKWLPSAYVLALILTLVAFLGAWGLTDSSLLDCVKYMSQGMYSLLSFTMQMVLVLVTGHCLASSKPVKKLLRSIAYLPKNRVAATLTVALVGMIATYLNWGLGMIAGALVAKEIARVFKGRGVKVDYAVLIAACHAGNIIRGPSSSIPLEVTAESSIVYEIVGDIIPTTATLYSSWNLIITVLVLISGLITYALICPRESECIEIQQAVLDADAAREEAEEKAHAAKSWKDMDFAEKLDNFAPLAIIPALIVVAYMVWYFWTKRTLNFGLNEVVLMFFAAGALCHKTPGNYSRAMGEAIKSAAGITLQFLFYAAIMGLVKNSGLVDILANFFVSISSAKTLPLFTLLGCWSRQHFHSLRRRTVDRAGPHHDAGRRHSERGLCQDSHGAVLGRLLDQPDSALLGAARAVPGRPGDQGHHGLLLHLCHCVRHCDLGLFPGPVSNKATVFNPELF